MIITGSHHGLSDQLNQSTNDKVIHTANNNELKLDVYTITELMLRNKLICIQLYSINLSISLNFNHFSLFYNIFVLNFFVKYNNISISIM